MNAPVNPFPSTPWDNLTRDQVLMEWQRCKDAIEVAKAAEMEIRKFIVRSAFPEAKEGTNTQELGNGYKLKAVVKYNYNLLDNDIVEKGLSKISELGNSGSFIADRLVSWHPKFLLSEYRQLQEDKDKGDKTAADIINIINTFLEIKEASPTLEIKEPTKKK